MPYKGRIVRVTEFRDIDERKLAEEKNAKLEAKLQQTHKMELVGQLAGGVAHDFNNMLTVIIGNADLAMMKMVHDAPCFHRLLEIRDAAQRSADITQQLLAFARKQTVAPKVLDLNDTLEGMLNMLRRLIGENIELVWLPGPNLWPVNVDPSQIDQILANLCVNAKCAIDGVGNITVETANSTFDEEHCIVHEGFMAGEYVRIAVSDNGGGMDKLTMPHIFEPFFTTKSVGEGTGLGLATVYGAVKQNNGFIDVSSKLGKGTTFSIYLPRHRGETRLVKIEGEIEPALLGHETILLVEDELSILEMTTTILQHLGYTVLPVSTPGEAIRMVNEFIGDINLVATDVIMPEMNGRELVQRLLTIQPKMKILFMSGYAANILGSQGMLNDGSFFIQKPFSLKKIATTVRTVLDSDMKKNDAAKTGNC
jgi:nitrogen-specific signal transduction histidine kinase/ActR/RegA family two-component response regulator